MPTIRVNKTENYSVISNIHLKDKTLSLKAKGLLSIMLSLPDDWDYSVAGLVSICSDKDKETAIETALDELKERNYLVVKKLLPNETKSGRIEYEYNIYEQPQEKQWVEKQGVEFLPLENHPQLNTNNKNTNNINIKRTLEAFIEETPKKQIVKEKRTKKSSPSTIISNLMKYVEEFDLETKQLLKNWLQELYDRKKGISKNALLLATQYLKEHFRKEEWKAVIEKATISGWRSFEYYNMNNQQTKPTTNLKSPTNSADERKRFLNNLEKNDKKFL